MREIIGERDDDGAIGFIEDLTDTLDDYDTRVSDTTNWKNLYETNDREWREKYKERFFGGSGSNDMDIDNEEPEDDKIKIKTFDELFS